MTDLTFAPAVRESRKLRLGLAGPSGSGKTFTALLVASTLGDRVGVIDTEHNSAAIYADRFAFDSLPLASFSPDTLVRALAASASAGHDVVVVDSLSHFWMGIDGMLEQVDAAAKRNSGNSFAGWKDARPMERRMVDALLAFPGHVIVTMRTKTEWVIEEDSRGKKVPKKIGTKPEQREGIEYEFDVVGDMDTDNTLIVSKTRAAYLGGAVISKPGEQFAKELREWAGAGSVGLSAEDYVALALDPGVSLDELRSLLQTVKARGTAATPVLDPATGDLTTVEAVIVARGRSLQALTDADQAGAA